MSENSGSNKKVELKKQVIIVLGSTVAAFITAFFGYKGVKYVADLQASQAAEERSLGLTQTADAKANSKSPTPTPTKIQAPSPTPTKIIPPSPTPTGENDVIKNGCLDIDIWTPYRKNPNVIIKRDCWDLSKWGFSATSNDLIIIPYENYEDGQAYGIYASIPEDVEIKFKIKIDKLETHKGSKAYIRYGFMEKRGPEKSYLIWHLYIPNRWQTKAGLYESKEDDKYYRLDSGTVSDFKTAYEVVITVKNSIMTISFDGTLIKEAMNLNIEDRVFYISYHLPPKSQLVAYIYDLEIHDLSN